MMHRIQKAKLSVPKHQVFLLILAVLASWEPASRRALRLAILTRGGETHRRVEEAATSYDIRPLPPCAASWGVFERGKSLLTETQVIPRSHPPPKINISTIDSSFDGFFFDPDANFAFCAIEKNACSQWQTVLRNVRHGRTDHGFRFPDFKLGRRSFERHGKEKLKQILESPDSTVVVMVRDPLARFASGYLNKCFDRSCTNSFCFPRERHRPAGRDSLVPRGQPISFRHALDWILGEDLAAIDPHFRSQSERCGMKDGGLEKYFTVVGRMREGSHSRSGGGDCIMEYANLTQYNIPAKPGSLLGGDNSTPPTFWGTGGVLWFEPHGRQKEEDELRKLFTKEAAQKLMEKFRQDYVTFQLPEPGWIASATGEWMDSLDHHQCRGRLVESARPVRRARSHWRLRSPSNTSQHKRLPGDAWQ